MRNSKLKILGLAATSMIIISGGNEAFAANGWDIPLNSTTTTTSQTNSSVSLSLGSGTIQTDLDAANASTNPDEAGKVLSQTATITVGNTDGYTVYVSGNANLTGRNNTSHKIPSVSNIKTLGNMSNEWGYYATLGDSEASFNPSTNFKAMTTSQQSVGTGGATSSSVTKKLTLFYGARVNNSAAEDFYENTVTLSMVAQPRTVTTTVTKFNGITTMQEMTSTICKNAAENDTAYLRDTRDGKYYWVTKLLDGNCWMSQNLDLDLTSSNIKASDSDVSSTWTDGRMATNISQTGLDNDTSTYAWDLGEYVIIDPTATTACDSNNTGLSACSEQFIDVSGKTPSTDPNFYKTHNVTYTSTEYDAHYLAGNYYQWNAATAGTGGAIKNQDATGSICPKNWKLPSANNDTTKGTFGYLLTQYGVQSKINIAAGAVASPVNSNNYDIALSPLFFLRGGIIWLGDSNTLSDAGLGGTYWSSRAYYIGTSRAYYLNVGSSSVNPSYGNYRYRGFSIRCFLSAT